MNLKINSPIRVSNESEAKKIAEVTDRNFISIWNIAKDLVKAVTSLQSKTYLEVISFDNETITVRVGGKTRTFKAD